MQQPKALRPDTPLENLDRISREHFRVAAVGIFIEENPLEVLQAVVDGGIEKFFRVAREHWAPHKFQMTDYDWMFQRIRMAVAMKSRTDSTVHG